MTRSLEHQLADYGQHLQNLVDDMVLAEELLERPVETDTVRPLDVPVRQRRRNLLVAAGAAGIILVLVGAVAISMIVFGSNEDVIDPSPTSTIPELTPQGGSWEAIATYEPLDDRFVGSGDYALYDSESDLILSYHVFDPPLTWLFDTNAGEWTAVAPGQQETRMMQDSGVAAYDPVTDRVIVFDDQRSTFAVDPDTGIWTNLAPAPGPTVRWEQAMAYDTQSEVAVMFGGRETASGTDPFGPEAVDETWTYDVAENLWSEQSPPVSPPPRVSPGMVYDSQSDRIVLFGGAEGDGWERSRDSETATPPNIEYVRVEHQVFDDTWVYDTDTATWKEMHPPVSPAPRIWAAMWYDPHADLVFLYGGTRQLVGPARDAWPLPSSVMFGGEDLWAYDLEADEWTHYQVASPNPGLLVGAVAAFDIESGVAVVFGGGRYDPETKNKGANTQTWIYRHVQ